MDIVRWYWFRQSSGDIVLMDENGNTRTNKKAEETLKAYASLYAAARDAFEFLKYWEKFIKPNEEMILVEKQLAAALTQADGEERIL